MMRTVKVESLELNRGKFEKLEAVAEAYAKEKQLHLDWYQRDSNFALSGSERDRRDSLTAGGYISSYVPTARLWRNAQKDAFETMDRYWSALAEEVRGGILKLDWTKEQQWYAFWLLKTPQRLNQLITGRAPINEKIELSLAKRKQVQNYLRRTVRKKTGRRPAVKMANSFTIDPNMYEVVQTPTGQAIRIATLVRNQRVYIPLKGVTELSGNLRVVLDRDKRRVFIHTQYELGRAEPLRGEERGVDVGITEVFVDDEGDQYGAELGPRLKAASERLNGKGKQRNKLHAVRKKHSARGNSKKAARIEKNNLGQKKQSAERKRLKTQINVIINTAINGLAREKKMSVLAHEKLDLRGKAQSKGISRRVSNYHRTSLKERLEFKASVIGFDRKQVNPAYTSQTCPRCGYLDNANRNGDRFQCLNCGHAEQADRVGALNIKARSKDPEIKMWTPRAQIKPLLQRRFKAGLESRKTEKGLTATVTRQTSDTKLTGITRVPGEGERSPS
jgi:putative transposase